MARPKKCDYQYEQADKFVIFNDNDPDLVPIKIALPKPPKDITKIAGYGLPPQEQKWKRNPLPLKLERLQRKKMPLVEYFKFLSANREEYKDEIKFIEQEWERREKGYWFYNNGKLTYITGLHYFFLNWWVIDIGHPKYRDRQRKQALFLEMCMQDPLCLGEAYPKMRQEGATTFTRCWLYERMSKVKRKRAGIQSKDDNSAYDNVFKGMIDSWRRLPFFFQPIFEGTNNPKKELSFYAPAQKIGSLDTIIFEDIEALESVIDYGDADIDHYDGSTLFAYYGDEFGKMKDISVYDRHQKVKPAVMKGTGKMVYTSTVGEMEKEGGHIAKEFCMDSMYDKRTKRGMTKTGLYVLFIPSDEGYDDGMISFIDEYGNSKKEEARQYLLDIIEQYEKDGQQEKAAEVRRQFPLMFKDCFAIATKDCSFNLSILNKRTGQFLFGNPYKRRGNFEWRGGIRDTIVDFKDDLNGKFYVSYFFDNPNLANRFLNMDGLKIPANATKFIAGGDPYRFKQAEGGKASNGGGGVFMKYDSSIDGNSPLDEWKTHRFIVTYSYRPPTKEEYGEDMVMMCHYYGCYMYPEINAEFLMEYFEDRGYVGYLFFRKSRKGKVEAMPGEFTVGKTKEEIFREYQQYIQLHGMRCVHDELLDECKEVTPETTGRFDRFMACGYALLGAKKEIQQGEYTETTAIDNYIDKWEW